MREGHFNLALESQAMATPTKGKVTINSEFALIPVMPKHKFLYKLS